MKPCSSRSAVGRVELLPSQSIKANLFAVKIELLRALDKAVDEKDLKKVEDYRKDQEKVQDMPRRRSRRPRRICSGTRSSRRASRCFRSESPWGNFGLDQTQELLARIVGLWVVGVVLLLVGFIIG